MRNNWNVGLLGAGFIVESHAKALKSIANVNLSAVCDFSPQAARNASKQYHIPNVFSTLEEMLESDIDVVHVLLPPLLHTTAARQIIDAGKHVFLEKPMGLDSPDCRSLVERAKEKNVKLGVSHNFLFLPAYEKLRKQLKDETLGRVDQITINWLYPLGLIQFGPFNNWMLSSPQNLIFELGPHLVAYMIDMVGPPDYLQVDAFAPKDLPGGKRVYRRWHVHGRVGNTGIDLNLAVTPGFTDRSINFRGHAAVAKCDFDRDLYYRDEPRGYSLLFDNFFTTLSVISQLSVNAIRNLTKTIVGTLRKTPEANPFGESIGRSIQAFYKTIGSTLDSRLDGDFGAKVIETCEHVLQKAVFEPPGNVDKKWVVLPPVQKPSILVIGGTGFIGRHLVEALIAREYGVRVTTRDINSAQVLLSGLPVELVQGSLQDAFFLDTAMDGIEVIYDLAKAEGSKWDDYYTQDVLVTKLVAERAMANNVKRFIYTGTIDSYYSGNKHEVITSDTPLDPGIKSRNHYARSKASCEKLLMNLHREKGFPVVIFRPGIVIGKDCPPAHWGVGMFLSETRVQFWGDGQNKLPLVLVEDVAEALCLGLDKPGIEGESFLLTGEHQISAREYVDIVSKESGTRLRSETTTIVRLFIIDAMKEFVKYLIMHPNRKFPSYRDWASRSHKARYDSAKTTEMLGWKPASTKEDLTTKAIIPATREFMC